MPKETMFCHLADNFFLELVHYNSENTHSFKTFNAIKQDFNFCGLSRFGSMRLNSSMDVGFLSIAF